MEMKDKTFVMNKDFVFREEEEGAFLFNPQTDELHCVNGVGMFICKLCNGKNHMDEICKRIWEEFDVDVEPHRLRQEVESFIERMLALNLLKERE